MLRHQRLYMIVGYAFRVAFPDPAEMLSSAATAVLLLLAWLLFVDTSSIECGHAMVMKLRRQVGKTHQQTAEMASAIVLLARQRLIEGTTSWTQRQPASTALALESQPDLRLSTDGDVTVTHERKFEHGGPYRVFCSMWMRERRDNNEDMALNECAAAYRTLREEGGDRWNELLAEGARIASLPQETSFFSPRQSKATRASLQAINDAVKTVQATQAARAAESQNGLAIVAQARADVENKQKG